MTVEKYKRDGGLNPELIDRRIAEVKAASVALCLAETRTDEKLQHRA